MIEALAAAAAVERDQRAEKLPERVAAGKISAHDASIDFQCWFAITLWLETDRFAGFFGGANPEDSDAPWIGWPQLEDAAAKALTSIDARTAALEARPDRERVADKICERHERRARLNAIHRKVALRRQLIESLNEDFRLLRLQPREKVAA